MKRDFSIGVAWTASASWLEQAVGAVTFMLIARLIGVEAFGVAALAFAFLFLGEFLVRDTIAEAIVERETLEDGRLEASFVVLIGFSLVIILALFAISKLTAILFGEPDVARLLMAASPTILMIAMAGVSTALLRRRMQYRLLAIRSVLGVVAGGIVGVTMALNGFGAWSLVGQRLVQIGVDSAFAFKVAGWVPRRWPTRSELALLRGLGPRVVLLRSITLVIAQTPTVVLGIFFAPSAVGLFAFALRLVEIVTFLIVSPLKGVSQSAFAAMRRQHRPTAPFFLGLTEITALAAFAAFAGLALIGEPTIRILVGPEWVGASAVLPFLCLAGAIYALTSMQESYLLAIDRVKVFTSMALLEAVVGLGLIALASPFGPVAISAAVAGRSLAIFPLRTFAALAPEAVAPVQMLRTLISPVLAVAAMSVTVAVWRAAMLGQLTDLMFVLGAVTIGIISICLPLFLWMPNTVANMQTFMQKEP